MPDAEIGTVTLDTHEEDIEKSEEILKRIKPFDGTGDVDLFLLKFDSIAQTCHWTEEDKHFYLLQKLRGAADQVLGACSKEQQNYAEVARRLRLRFSNAKSPEQARLELQSRRQRESETLQELAGDIQNLTVLCAPQFSYEQRERYLGLPAFLDALTDNRLRFELEKKQFSTIDDALHEAL